MPRSRLIGRSGRRCRASTCKTSVSNVLMMMCSALRALQRSGSVGYDGMAPPVQYAKHQINAYLMSKVWTYGIDGSLQSSLPMPRRSRHGSSWLSELPLA